MSGGIARNITASDDELVVRFTGKRDRIKQEHEALESEIETQRTNTVEELSRHQKTYQDAQRALNDAQANLDEAQLRWCQCRRNQEARERLARVRLSSSRNDLRKAEDDLRAALEPEPMDQECSVCFETIPGPDLKQIRACKHCFCERCLLTLM
jgi:hypothetical protein